MLKIYMMIIVVGLVCGVVYGGYYYYQDTQNRISTLQQNNAKLETAIQSKNEVIEVMTSDYKKSQELNKELSANLQEAEEYGDNLIRKLQKHDMTRLSIAKPGRMEKIINDGTKDLFNSLESITAK
jgi:Na+-transporting NADH:ubiquinone oxidoreductase subunit NqrC|tara:strand:- start:243 stop:620 length:378 start_codon:yes stop_codon:yes gene_type:complete